MIHWLWLWPALLVGVGIGLWWASAHREMRIVSQPAPTADPSHEARVTDIGEYLKRRALAGSGDTRTWQ